MYKNKSTETSPVFLSAFRSTLPLFATQTVMQSDNVACAATREKRKAPGTERKCIQEVKIIKISSMSDVFIFTQQRQRLRAYCLRNISSVKGHSHNQINFYVSLGVWEKFWQKCGKEERHE